MRPTTALAEVGDLTQRYATQDKAGAFTKFAQALALAGGDGMEASSIFATRWPNSKHVETVRKAAVGAATLGGWGGELAPLKPLGTAYLDFIRPLTVLGRLSGIRRAPFQVPILSQTSGFGAAWAGEGRPIIVARADFTRKSLKPTKIAGIVVMSRELAEATDPASEAMIQRDMTASVVEFSDRELLDPTLAAVDGVSPASITNAAPEITSTGTTAAQVEADLSAMVASLITGGVAFAAPTWVMKPSTALYLARLRGSGGERIFPDVGPMGGTIWTIPVVTSVAAGDQITLLDGAEVLVAEEDIQLSSSDQGSLQMNDAPTQDATGGTGSTMVSLWQSNLLALKIVRTIRWERRRDEAVAWMAVAY